MEPVSPVKNDEKTPSGSLPLRVLVVPLDWGLGHATRCIPLIRALLDRGAGVWLAGEGAQEKLLREAFPALPFLALKGYRVRYAKTARGLAWKMLLQLPRLFRAVRYEQQWLQQAVEQYGFHAVISDNRYGLYHSSIPAVLITHQLSIQSPPGTWAGKLIRRLNYKYINRFSQCWVPDHAGPANLAGILSHPDIMPDIPVTYTGPLSRFSKTAGATGKDHLLILLSGPEPQRSLLEEIMIRAISQYSGTATLVRGLPGHTTHLPSTEMIQCYNHLPAETLQAEMEKASLLIARSGYSTLMDAAVLGKKCIFIPTPGQTEQEYLARYCMEKGWALAVPQDSFSLETALQTAKAFSFREFPAADPEGPGRAVQSLLQWAGRDLG